MQSNITHGLVRISLLAVIVAWLVIGLGALTRLTDAGLGCPDWPGCYGHIGVPVQVLTTAMMKQKAWTEMIHRYCAGTLAVLVFLVATLCVLNAARHGVSYLVLALVIFLLVIYQALLGMWTVTLTLWPIVVSQHLLGGMGLFALLWLIFLKSWTSVPDNRHHFSTPYPLRSKIMALCGLMMLALQIALGAWTSTNYAALSCPDFPFCQGHWQQTFDFAAAFNVSAFGGMNYEGGVLSAAARQTIHMTHRIMAGAVMMYVIFMLGYFYRQQQHDPMLRKAMGILLILLMMQITWGILNIVLVLPLGIAVLHNLTAGLLLCAMVTVNYAVFRRQGAMVYE